jgi:hypothetical protein
VAPPARCFEPYAESFFYAPEDRDLPSVQSRCGPGGI